MKLLSHDLGLRPLKIISLISNKAKCLGGVNTGYAQEKTPLALVQGHSDSTFYYFCP